MTPERRADLRATIESGGDGYWLHDLELLWLLDAADERDAYKHAHAVEEQAVEDVTRERERERETSYKQRPSGSARAFVLLAPRPSKEASGDLPSAVSAARTYHEA